ncbi:NADH:ubiquinone oxidoreductase intermediate-associated protein 30 protein [Raphanus sativus]|nr:NADH:ubiquinone oxidoreductase intermediate-associated protein 30 protein [Raphanus sativus]
MSRFRSLWQASVNATKKALTWELEEMVPAAEKCIFKFRSKEDLKRWHLYSDSEYGGLSLASLEIKDGGNGSGCTDSVTVSMRSVVGAVSAVSASVLLDAEAMIDRDRNPRFSLSPIY